MESLDDLYNRADSIAYELGMKAGCNYANWAEQYLYGGRFTGDQKEAARAVLKALEDCDDAIYDGLPNLSGEDADGPTPRSLLEDVLYELDIEEDPEAGGEDEERKKEVEDILDDLCEQWEMGVRDGYIQELTRLATNAASE